MGSLQSNYLVKGPYTDNVPGQRVLSRLFYVKSLPVYRVQGTQWFRGNFKRVYFWPQGRVHSKMCLPVQKVLYKLYNCPEDRAQRIHLFRDSWPEHIPDQRILRVYIYQAIVSSSEYVPVQMFMYRVNTFLEYCVQLINLTGGSSVEYKPV